MNRLELIINFQEKQMIAIDEHKILTFKIWLEAHGSAILPSTCEAEIARFITRYGVGSIYTNQYGEIERMENGADEAWMAFRTGGAWRGSGPRHRKRRKKSKRLSLLRKLAYRDGWNCAYCGTMLSEHTATLEHVDPLTSGGYEHISNMTLACRPCNAATGSMCARQKIEFAVKFRCSSSSAQQTHRWFPGFLKNLLGK